MILSNKQPIKRLVVRNFRGQKLPDDFEASSWAALRQGITAILDGEQPSSCLETLYKTCENMVRCNFGANLYSKVYEVIELFNKSYAETKFEKSAGNANFSYLEYLSTNWMNYLERLGLVENVLMYLDRCYVLQRPELLSIHSIGVAMYKNYILEEHAVCPVVEELLLESLAEGRRKHDENWNAGLHKPIISMLLETGTFAKFEGKLVERTRGQYKQDIVGEEFASHEHVKVIQYYLSFEERVGTLIGLPKDTKSSLIKAVESVLLKENLGKILATGIPAFIEVTWKDGKASDLLDIAEPPLNEYSELECEEDDKWFCLDLLVKLALRVGGQDLLKSNWSTFIKSYGSSIVSSGKDTLLIEEILRFKSSIELVLSKSLGHLPMMEGVMREAFENFLNARSTRLAELIARFFDQLLREGNPSNAADRLSDEQLLEIFDRVVILFRFLQNKEAVETHYKHLLARRLLQGRSISVLLERQVIKRFKGECGASFTSRLEGMFKDVDLGPELNRAFKESPHAVKGSPEFQVTVISSGIWPQPDPETSITLPDSIIQAQESFSHFYTGKHDGRRVEWSQQLGHCIVKAPFPQGTKELQVSIPQAVILDCFNRAEKMSLSDVQKATGMDRETVGIVLDSLAVGRHQILVKEDGDVYAYNSSFSSRLVRIRLNTAGDNVSSSATKDAGEDRPAASAASILESKQHQLDAAIVRTIKSAKRIPASDLIAKSIQALGLALDQVLRKEVEKRIELLIARDFMTRDGQDPSILLYVS